ncbi:hypothetical protein [Streptomyces platensis]|uniref:hypothetical protein n=1 Tax=Streptomyces platensis TaxID=58346 RepID=UPI0037A67F06
MSARDEILAALRRAGYGEQGAESLLGRAEADKLREAQREVVAWLVKKAGEYRSVGNKQHRLQADTIGTLASKVDRGAIRLFLAAGKDTCDAGPVARNVQCGDCGAHGDVRRASDALLYLFPSGQIGHPRAAEGGDA